jgi:hypothetical protein
VTISPILYTSGMLQFKRHSKDLPWSLMCFTDTLKRFSSPESILFGNPAVSLPGTIYIEEPRRIYHKSREGSFFGIAGKAPCLFPNALIPRPEGGFAQKSSLPLPLECPRGRRL